jgi:hypothetical protein
MLNRSFALSVNVHLGAGVVEAARGLWPGDFLPCFFFVLETEANAAGVAIRDIFRDGVVCVFVDLVDDRLLLCEALRPGGDGFANMGPPAIVGPLGVLGDGSLVPGIE